MMRLLAVNVSQPKTVRSGDKIITTGIFKQPVEGRVRLRALNLDGDGQADLKHHGGIHPAHLEHVADVNGVVEHPLDREVLAELAVAEVVSAKLALPVVVVLDRVGVGRLGRRSR